MSDLEALFALFLMLGTFAFLGIQAGRLTRRARVAAILAEEPATQSADVANLGIAIATLDAALEGIREAVGRGYDSDGGAEGEPGPVVLLRAQSDIIEVAAQVDELLGHLPEADQVVADLLGIEPGASGGPLRGGRARHLDDILGTLKGVIARLERARVRVRNQEARSALVAEARAEAEAIEAARQAGTSSATVRDKERS